MGLPLLVVDQAGECPLQRVVADGLGLPDQQRQFRGNPRRFSTRAGSPPRVVEVHECLAEGDVAGVHAAREAALVNALNLVGERNGVALVS